MAAIWRWYKKRSPVEKSPRVKAPGAERRGPVRYAAHSKAVLNLITLANKAGRPVEIQDVSTHGVGLLAAAPVELGVFFVLEIGRPPAELTRLKGRVVRQRPAGKGRWLLGCVFVAELTADQLDSFL